MNGSDLKVAGESVALSNQVASAITSAADNTLSNQLAAAFTAADSVLSNQLDVAFTSADSTLSNQVATALPLLIIL